MVEIHVVCVVSSFRFQRKNFKLGPFLGLFDFRGGNYFTTALLRVKIQLTKEEYWLR